MTVARAQWPVALVAIVVPLGVAAQQPQPPAPSGQCQLVYAARDSSSPPRISATKLPSGQYNTFIGGGVIARCPAQNMTLVSDSAENYGDQKLLHLIGHVHYTEPRLTEDSELADYYQADEHLVASGNVHAVLPSGTTLDGPHVDYYRVAPNIRTVTKMVATGRPTITIIEHDSTGKPSQPMTVVANTVDMEGDSLTYASMNVVITRTDVIATGDSAAMNSATEFARLMRKPTIKARGDRPFTLTGDLIDLFGRNKAVDRVISRGHAKSVSKDATLTGDTLDFAMAEGRLQRVHAWGASRAHAFNPTYDMLADSLDVRMPDQRLREIHALHDAYAQSVPDTTRIHTSEHDWLRGDTIYAYFDSSAKALADTSTQPEIKRLISFGHARSFYQIAAKDTTAIGPSINYVRGDRIQVAFLNREVQTVTIKGEATGVYLDPAKPARDTTKKGATDTATVKTPNATPKARADTARGARPR